MLKLNRDLMKVKFEDLSTRESDNNHALKRACVLTVPVEHSELGSTPFYMRARSTNPVESDVLLRDAMDGLRKAELDGTIEIATADVWVERALASSASPPSPETMAWLDALNARVLELKKTAAEAAAPLMVDAKLVGDTPPSAS